MKYKKIVTDNKLKKTLKKVNTKKIAEAVGVSPSYLYMAIKGDFAITEELYKKLWRALEG